MATMEAVLTRFDESKAKVRKEIREGMFHDDGTLRLSERELRAWIADRAVDELKVVLQLSTVIARAGHLIPGHILVRVTEQVSDEARHFDILRALVPEDMHQAIDEKVAALPATLAADKHWAGLLVAVDAGNPFAALLDVNIVHEGYSAAAIEELVKLPFEDVTLAYASIGADEEKHHESGRDLLVWLAGASQLDGGTGQVVSDAHNRATGGAAMSWSWPSAEVGGVVETAHERAAAGTAMSWSWPASATGE